MKNNFNKNYILISLYVIAAFFICLTLVSFAVSYEKYKSVADRLIEALTPVITGVIIAYLFNPLMKRVESGLNRLNKKNKIRKRTVRFAAAAVMSALFLSALFILIFKAFPEIAVSIERIFINLRPYINRLNQYAGAFLNDNPQINDAVTKQIKNIETHLYDLISGLQPQFEKLIQNIAGGTISFLKLLINLFCGIIISVYLLINKETLTGQAKKALYAFLPAQITKKFLSALNKINAALIRYFSAKAFDSLRNAAARAGIPCNGFVGYYKKTSGRLIPPRCAICFK